MNKIFKNSLFSILQAIIVTPITFILVPYTISKIGKEGYGLFALVGVISSYQVFVEMGLTTTLIRFVSKANVTKDINAISEFLNTTLLFFIIISVLAYLVIVSFSSFLVTDILGIKTDIELVIFLVKISALTGIINLISGLFKSILDGLQRMDISNIILTFQVIISAVGTFLFLNNGLGIKGLAINGLMISFLTLITNIFFSKKLIHYQISITKFKMTRFKEMFKYSVNLQLSNLIYFWTEPLNKILISNFLGLSFVGYYDIALKFTSRITNFVRSALSSLFPATSEVFERDRTKGIENLRKKSLKYLYPSIMFIYVLGIIFTKPFVNLWLGAEFNVVSNAIIILLIGSFISILATPPYVILMGAGFSQDTLRVQFQSIIVNISAVILFSLLFGFYGFCTGYTLSMIYSFFVTNFAYKNRFKLDDNIFKFLFHRRLISITILVIIIGVITKYYFIINSWNKFVIFALLLMLIYLFSFWKSKIITESDICLLFGINRVKEILFLFRRRK